MAAEDSEFEQHFGFSIPRIVDDARQGHHRAAQGRRRQHADATAGAQAVPDRREDVGAEDQGSAARDPDREALHQARDLHALLQPDVLRPRRLRRRGGVAAVFRQVGKGPDGRGGRAIAGHPPGQRAPEPVRQHGRGASAPQLHARPDGGGRLHQRGRGGGRKEEADHPSRRAVGAALRRALLPRRSSQGARRPVRRQAAVRERSRDPDRARRRAAGGGQPRARRGAPPHRPAARIPKAPAQRRCRRPRDRDLPTSALGSPDEGIDDIVPAVVTNADGATIELRAGPFQRHGRSRRGSRGRARRPRHSS